MTTASYPRLIGEIIGDSYGVEERQFPFVAWAGTNGFKYPEAAKGFLRNVGSAVEAYFARAFAERPGVEFVGRRAYTKDYMLELQVRCLSYRIDAVVCDETTCLAIELDGHHRAKEQVAADYMRQRRITLKGYSIIRFTAQEVLRSPAECWRQVEAILASRKQFDAKSQMKSGK